MRSSFSDIRAVEGGVIAEGTESEGALDVPKGLLVESSWQGGGYSGSVWIVATEGDLDGFLLLRKGCVLPGLNQQLVWVTQESKGESLSIIITISGHKHCCSRLRTLGIIHIVLNNLLQDRNITYSPDPSINCGKSSTLALP